MNLLLDTHIVLWWLIEPERLSPHFSSAIKNTQNAIYVSTASVWEISIKKHLGKLAAPDDFMEVLAETGFAVLPMTPSHAWLAGSLPFHHYDPFDRLIAAQSIQEKLTLVSVDAVFPQYGVTLLKPAIV